MLIYNKSFLFLEIINNIKQRYGYDGQNCTNGRNRDMQRRIRVKSEMEWDFVLGLDNDLEKINLFFSEKMSYCLRTLQELQQVWNQLKQNPKRFKNKIKVIQGAIPELYLLAKER